MGEQLSENVRETVKGTVPALERQGLEVVDRFYNLMFEKHPGVRAYFSDGAFKSEGEPPIQVQRLGRAVIAFAKNIDNPDVLMDTIRRVGEIHVSRNVRSSHYPIIGKCLLEAMKEVIAYEGEEWKIAFQWLADVFIAVEKEVRENAKKTAGYEGFRQYTVDKMINEEACDATTLVLKPGDFNILDTKYSGGKFVCLTFYTPNAKYRSKITAYLSDVGNSDYLQVTVRRSAVSKLDSNETVGVSPTFGNFHIRPIAQEKNVAFVSTDLEVGRMFAALKSLLLIYQDCAKENKNVSILKILFLVVSGASPEPSGFLFAEEVRNLKQAYSFLSVEVLKEKATDMTKDDLSEAIDMALGSSDERSVVLLSSSLKNFSEGLKPGRHVQIVE